MSSGRWPRRRTAASTSSSRDSRGCARTSSRDQATSLRAQITPLPEKAEKTIEVEAHVRRIQELIEKALSITSGFSEELRDVVISIEDPLRLAYVLATLIDMKPVDKQALLEEDDILKKLLAVADALTREVSLLELKGKIESQAQQEMTDAQRQYYLRQQLKAIQQELGEGEGNELLELRSADRSRETAGGDRHRGDA